LADWHIVCILFAHLYFTARRKASFASAVNATVNPSVHHTPILCQNEETQSDAVSTIG